ncbi:hypothetical protein [Enterobacter sp. ENT03]|uniref:hypothetical protein n=1 Tax=Enterobacter sp. ENT03 TaxID=2854780 RepID=UPI001C449C7C|nr:hypothetical protein [Enterobacter sp. ENT03]MBV7405799.1 hypothetical protein [Enterobacter sp. ENT03]
MKKFRLILAFFFMVSLPLFYFYSMTRVFVDEEYTQHDYFRYILLTPGPLKKAPRVSDKWYFIAHAQEVNGLQKSELIFKEIPISEIDLRLGQLESFIDNYPDDNAILSVFTTSSDKKYELRIVYYETNDNT